MLVESYEIEEVASATSEETECAQALVNKLGLEKQKAFHNPDRPKSIAWRRITNEEVFAFSHLCPQVTKLEDYQSGPIPLRVLEILERAQESGFFKSFVVWHPQDVRTDPVLIGIHQGSRGSWDEEQFLIARWGEVLDEMPALMRKATEAAKFKARRIVAQAQAMLAQVESGDTSIFNGRFEPYLATGLRL